MSKATKKLLKGPDAPKTRRRFWKTIKDVVHYAKPHWLPMAASFALMVVNSTANKGRLLVLLPVFTQILEIDADSFDDPGDAALLNKAQDKGGWLIDLVEGAVSGVGGLLDPLISESWYADGVTKVDKNKQPLDEAAIAAKMEKQRNNYRLFFGILILMIFLIAVMCSASYFEGYLAAYASVHMMMDVRERAVSRTLSQPISFFDRLGRGELVQRLLGDVGGYGVGITMIFTMARVTIDIIVTFVVLIAMAPVLLLMALLAIPFLLPIRKLSKRVLKRSHKRQEESVKLVQSLLQVFSGVRTVKAFGSEKRHIHDFRVTDEGLTRRALKVQRAKSAASAVITFLNNSLMVILVLGGGWMVFTGRLDLSPGELFIAMFLLSTVYQPIKRIVKHLNNYVDSMASIERATEYLELPDGSLDRPGAQEFPGVDEGIRFEDVDFHYVEGEPVLKQVSFAIPRGATVALVGSSGGGKSTICDLLLGFYEPASGAVRVNGVERANFTRASFLDRVAIVSQTPFLFHSSIRDNIRQGRITATQEEVEAAAKAANIHDTIMSFPLGYDEIVGEEGVRLSGGQRQRITIARALVRNPDILVLDEATASLDTQAERAVQEALDRLREGRTTLVVAHRLSTIRSADQILVVDGGQIVERGTHNELIKRSGSYAQLVKLQDLRPDD